MIMIKIQLMIEDEKLNKKISDILGRADYELNIINDLIHADADADIILLDMEAAAAGSQEIGRAHV